MKILVSGGAGFIGSHVADTYLKAGHEVVVIDDLSTGHKKNVPSGATFKMMDARDPNIITLFAKERFDVVNHLGAQIDVRKSVQDPFVDASINILGTLRLLDCCRSYGVRKFIFSSSGGTIYGECGDGPAAETAPARPESPYGLSKETAEKYILAYKRFYQVSFTILRYGNVFGPRQDAHGEAGVVAIFCNQLLSGKAVTIYGDGNQERDFVYVGDVAQANLAALSTGENQTFNIGTGVPTSVNQLYAHLQKISNVQKSATKAPERAGELRRSLLDISLAKKGLGWEPRVSLSEGLQQTYDFFQSQLTTGASKTK